MDLRQDAGDKSFRLVDGIIIHNVEELRERFLNVPSQHYNHHVNKEKNDFSNWIRDVYGDKKLAKLILKAKTPLEAAKSIRKRLAETDPKVITKTVKALKPRHSLKKKIEHPKATKIDVPKRKVTEIKFRRKKKRLKSTTRRSNIKDKKSVIELVRKTIKKTPIPNAHKFFTAYMAMQRPTSTHLYFSKGIADFLLGLVIGILVGIVMANLF